MDELDNAKKDFYDYNVRGITEEVVIGPNFFRLKEIDTDTLSLGTSAGFSKYQLQLPLDDIRGMIVSIRIPDTTVFTRQAIFPIVLDLQDYQNVVYQKLIDVKDINTSLKVMLTVYTTSEDNGTIYLEINNVNTQDLEANLTLYLFD